MLEYACKKECKLFYQHVEDFKLKLGVLEYADKAYFPGLRDSISHDRLELPIQYARSKGVSDDSKCFGDFCHLQKSIKK
jgi:hypothetical protein